MVWVSHIFALLCPWPPAYLRNSEWKSSGIYENPSFPTFSLWTVLLTNLRNVDISKIYQALYLQPFLSSQCNKNESGSDFGISVDFHMECLGMLLVQIHRVGSAEVWAIFIYGLGWNFLNKWRGVNRIATVGEYLIDGLFQNTLNELFIKKQTNYNCDWIVKI